ncbi:MAG TPA: exodeoxyribonuclease VII large subunit [Alphaproteobacteria bacterium]|nr:MAG: exodeoxyribonuclease VII large subunit [Rhodospirillales bacterium]HOO81730.1 exodeoxyribonuclease VII large subunit [Alphaproteobacteria bacterium]
MSESEAQKTKIQTETHRSNIPEFSVSDLALSLKRTLEENYGRIRVRGELSRISIAGSGHLYSSLKDDQAVIDAVCWKGVLSNLSVKPEEGLEVICTGRISSYPKSSKYQLIIESMELAGEGALLKMLEERKKKLGEEGLFAPERKKPLPFLPQTIGVVTSPTGAVIRDILHRLADRFPRHVLVWPVLVQGDGAANQVASAIRSFQTIHKHGQPRPDLLIVARGGGSLEDLMPFNEEDVVRAIAESEIPIISAIGHETDTTLADFAADVRAPTPTGAAEMAVPVRANLIAQILEDEQRLISGMTRLLSEHRHKIESLSARLGDPARLLETQTQRIDHLSYKLSGLFSRFLDTKKHALSEQTARLRHPRERLAEASQNLSRWNEHLETLSLKLTREPTQKLDHLGKMLEAYSFENILQRGFSVVRDEKGTLIPDASNIHPNQVLDIQFRNQGHIQAITTSKKASKPKTKKRKAPPPAQNDPQTNLFD